MTSMDVSMLTWLAVGWAVYSVAVTLGTWTVARTRVQSPLRITMLNLLLSLFPPVNLLVLAALSVMDRRTPP